MKNLSLITALIILLIGADVSTKEINAQSRLWRYGVAAGVNAHTMHIDNALLEGLWSVGYNAGFEIRLAVVKGVNSKLAFAAEPGFAKRGYREKSPDVSEWNPVSLNYVTLPVLTHLFLERNFSAFLGPELGYLAKAKKDNGLINDLSNGEVTDSFNRVDFGLVGGLSFEFKNQIALRFWYQQGLANLVEPQSLVDDMGNDFGKVHYRTRSLMLSISYVTFRKQQEILNSSP